MKSVIGLAILVAAHRGGAQLWPENSLLAFGNALGLGVDAVETDVHMTSDGEIVVIHDPTLAQLLDLLAPQRAQLLLEIKVDARNRRYPGIEEKALALLRSRRMAERTLVMAFEPETVARVRELDPAIRTVLLVGRRHGARDAVQQATALRANVIGYDFRLLDADLMAATRTAGLKVAAWTVNEETDIRRIVGLGVDVVISDRPDLALRLVRP